MHKEIFDLAEAKISKGKIGWKGILKPPPLIYNCKTIGISVFLILQFRIIKW